MATPHTIDHPVTVEATDRDPQSVQVLQGEVSWKDRDDKRHSATAGETVTLDYHATLYPLDRSVIAYVDHIGPRLQEHREARAKRAASKKRSGAKRSASKKG